MRLRSERSEDNGDGVKIHGAEGQGSRFGANQGG